MRGINKALTGAVIAAGIAEMASEISCMFETVMSRGSKLDLAKCTDLKREEKIVENDNRTQEKIRRRWEEKSRNTVCYVKGYDSTPLYCKVYAQKMPTHKWVMAVHGYGGDGCTLAYASKSFYDKGYNVAVPDLRGHGKSGGKYIGMGHIDSRDIIKMIYMIIKGDSKAEIYLYGVSMGAAAVLMAASESLPNNVKAVISDCSFDNANRIIGYELKHSFKLPYFPLVPLMDIMCMKRAGYDLRLASPVDRVGKIKIPVLFIHGGSDKLVPTKMVFNLYKRAKCKKALIIIKDAGHGVSALVDGERYWRGVFNFIDKVKKAA